MQSSPGFYTGWLLPAALVGLGVFIYGLVTLDQNSIANEICRPEAYKYEIINIIPVVDIILASLCALSVKSAQLGLCTRSVDIPRYLTYLIILVLSSMLFSCPSGVRLFKLETKNWYI